MAEGVAASTQLDESKLLLELSRNVTSTLDLEEVMKRSFAALRQLVDFDGGAILLVHEDHLTPAATDPPAPPQVMTLEIPIGEGKSVSGGIAASGEARYIADIAELQPSSGGFRATSGGVRSYFGWPLILQGEVAGVVQVDSTRVDAFTTHDQAVVVRFAPSIAMAVQNALSFGQQTESMIRLQEAQQLKRDFVSVISHELRTPLAAVLGFAETLAANSAQLDPATIQTSCERILQAGNKLRSMIDDLLDLSEIERRLVKLDIEPVDPARVVKEAAFEARSGGPSTITEIEDDLPLVLADGGRLHQVLENLIDNARRFSPPEKPVTVRAVADGKRVSISVSDEGRGIAEHQIERIFEPFFQVEDSGTRTIGGLGVGLYLVKEICTAMDVDIDVWSEPDTGSRFTLHIPVAD